MIGKQAHAQISTERPALEPFIRVDLKVCFLASSKITNYQLTFHLRSTERRMRSGKHLTRYSCECRYRRGAAYAGISMQLLDDGKGNQSEWFCTPHPISLPCSVWMQWKDCRMVRSHFPESFALFLQMQRNSGGWQRWTIMMMCFSPCIDC